MTLNSHKCSDTKSDVIAHGAQAAALSVFNQALLFKGAMIYLNMPRGLAKPSRSASLIPERLVARYYAVPTASADTEHFDFAETFEPNIRPAAAQSGIGYSFHPAPVDVDLAV